MRLLIIITLLLAVSCAPIPFVIIDANYHHNYRRPVVVEKKEVIIVKKEHRGKAKGHYKHDRD